MPRGGKRPGAGAPRYNINALKNGRRSRQLKALYAFLVLHPVFRNLLLHQHMHQAPKPSRAKLRRLYLDILARALAAQYTQSNSVPLYSLEMSQENKSSDNNQNPTLSDLLH